MDLVITDRFTKIQAHVDSMATIVGPTVETLDARMREIEFALARALSLAQEPQPPGIC